MAFQFYCPQGHLLQGDEAHMGMQTQCPHCGMAFIIPRLAPQQQQPQQPQHSPAVDPRMQPFNFEAESEPRRFEPAFEQRLNPVVEEETPAVSELLDEVDLTAAASMPGIVHIPCPNGHELETPLDMIGQEVLCPHCGAQFRLRNEDSLEFKHAQDIIDRKRARAWFNAAIAAAVVVLIGLATMIVISVQ